jgi:hypothetical protein
MRRPGDHPAAGAATVCIAVVAVDVVTSGSRPNRVEPRVWELRRHCRHIHAGACRHVPFLIAGAPYILTRSSLYLRMGLSRRLLLLLLLLLFVDCCCCWCWCCWCWCCCVAGMRSCPTLLAGAFAGRCMLLQPPAQIMAAVCSGEQLLTWPLDAHLAIVHLGRACLSFNPRDRPSFAQVRRSTVHLAEDSYRHNSCILLIMSAQSTSIPRPQQPSNVAAPAPDSVPFRIGRGGGEAAPLARHSLP